MEKFSSSLSHGKICFGKYPRQEEVDTIMNSGYRIFVDLTTSDEVTWPVYELPPDIIYYSCPIKDRTPTAFDRDWFHELVNLLVTHIGDEDKIYVHCRGGHGRSGMFAAIIYALVENVSATKALKDVYSSHQRRTEMDEKWRKMGAPQSRSQKAFVTSYLEDVV
jgi:protein-tyrosine phosphatase